MSPFFRRFAIACLALLLGAPAAVALGTADASQAPQPGAVMTPPAATPVVAELPPTTAAPATTVAPAPISPAPIVKAAAATPAAAAPVSMPTEIGTACVMTRNADGSIASDGC